MSKEHVIRFLQAVADDDALITKLERADAQALTAIAAAKGFDFTVAELHVVLGSAETLDELTDEQLGQVAGGGSHAQLSAMMWEVFSKIRVTLGIERERSSS